LVTSPDSTGKGMYEVFCNITEKYNINCKSDLCAQAYDGAASMQDQYSGLKTLIQNENPNALYRTPRRRTTQLKYNNYTVQVKIIMFEN